MPPNWVGSNVDMALNPKPCETRVELQVVTLPRLRAVFCMQFPAEHRASPVGIEYVEVAGDKAAMAEWIGPGWEDLPLRCGAAREQFQGPTVALYLVSRRLHGMCCMSDGVVSPFSWS